MSTFGEEGKPPSSAMNTAALDTSWLDELPAAQGRRGSRRRTIRRRKTISPSKVTSFMDGVDFANDDPMSWPDIPYDDDIGKGVVDTSDKATSRKLSPGAGPAADGVSLYDERSDGPSNKAGTSWAASTDVAALLLVEREEETLEQQRKPSKPLGVLSALENHDGMSSLSRDDSSTNKSAQAVSVGKEALPAGARVSSGAENVQPPTEVTRTATGAAAAKPSPAEINREEVVVEPAAGASSSSSGTLGQPRVRKTSRTSRRRSIVMPSEARPFMDSADCAVGDGNANSAHSGGGAGAIASGGNEGATPATKNSSSGSTTIEKAMVRVTPAPVGAVTATSCLSCPLATQRGWKSEEGDTTRTLVRAYYAAPRGSQRARRVAARLFCITGYCLLPVTPEDARVLCEAAGDSLDWGLEETDKPQLKSKTFRRKTREQKRGLVLRIKVSAETRAVRVPCLCHVRYFRGGSHVNGLSCLGAKFSSFRCNHRTASTGNTAPPHLHSQSPHTNSQSYLSRRCSYMHDSDLLLALGVPRILCGVGMGKTYSSCKHQLPHGVSRCPQVVCTKIVCFLLDRYHLLFSQGLVYHISLPITQRGGTD